MPPAPPEYEDLPVERWVEEAMGGGPGLYGDEELFYRWLDGLGSLLTIRVGARVAEERNEPAPGFSEEAPPLSEEVIDRIVDALPPHIERWRRVFAEAAPGREAKRRMAAEYERRKAGGRYGKGREWLRNWDREREELRRKYDGWEREWGRWYAEWCRGRGADPLEEPGRSLARDFGLGRRAIARHEKRCLIGERREEVERGIEELAARHESTTTKGKS